jgi:tRNA(adenine34) deaminase
MQSALSQGRLARDCGDVPIGCVVVDDLTGQVIGTGHNRRECDRDATGHAEILAIRGAGAARGHWRLTDCTIYVTLEPCPMCAGAIVNARIPRLVYGADDPKAGAVKTLFQLCTDPRLNHRVDVLGGVMAAESVKLLQDFFKAQRALGKK